MSSSDVLKSASAFAHLLGALEADAAEIIDHPVRLLGLADGVDALGIDVGTFSELLASP